MPNTPIFEEWWVGALGSGLITNEATVRAVMHASDTAPSIAGKLVSLTSSFLGTLGGHAEVVP